MVLRDMRTTLGERFLSYLHRQGQPAEYELEELLERYLLLDWLASCLCFHRPIVPKQLLLYGVPKAQRRLLFYLLSPVLRILFITSSRVEEALNERNRHFDLCVLEEYPDQSFTFFESSPRILFHKKGNPPLVVVAASLEASADGIDPNPFRSRLIRLRFSSQIPDLDEGRLIATLWGCVRRRVFYSPYAFFSTTPNDLCLDYRDSEVYFIPNDLDPEKRSFHKMCMDRYMGFALSAGETPVTLKRDFVHKARAVPGVQGCSLRKSDRRYQFLSICNLIEHAQRVAKLLLQSFRRKGATLSVHTRLRCNSIEKASSFPKGLFPFSGTGAIAQLRNTGLIRK